MKTYENHDVSLRIFENVMKKPMKKNNKKHDFWRQALNFKGDQIRLAMGKTGGYDARAPLEWLLVNLPKKERRQVMTAARSFNRISIARFDKCLTKGWEDLRSSEPPVTPVTPVLSFIRKCLHFRGSCQELPTYFGGESVGDLPKEEGLGAFHRVSTT